MEIIFIKSDFFFLFVKMACSVDCNLSGRSEKKILCKGMCNQSFHLKCVGLAEYDLNLINTKANVIFICNDCKDFRTNIAKKIEYILSEISESKDKLNFQENNIKLILNEVKKLNNNSEEISNKLKNRNMQENGVETYASACKNVPPILVKPKTAQTIQKTKEDIQKKIDPTTIKYTSIKNKQNGVMAIESDTITERENIKKVFEEKLGSKYEIKMTELRNPKLCIKGVHEKFDESEIIHKLRNQNDILYNSEMKCLRIIEKKTEKYTWYNVIVEMDSESFNQALLREKLCIGWDRCIVVDATYVKRCFKCLGYNHKSVECKNKKVCFNCLGEHDKKDCVLEKVDQCINCKKANERLHLNLDINHNVYNRECQVYLQKLQYEKKRNNY